MGSVLRLPVAIGPSVSSTLTCMEQFGLHTIAAEDSVEGLGKQSASDLDLAFLTRLRDAGRAATQDWIDAGE